MSNGRANLRKTGRIGLFTTAIGLALAAGGVNPAFAAGSPRSPQPISKADANPGGANGQCPGGPYCSTRNGAASLNGNGNGKAVGKPCAGCVGKADNKNPPGQMPNGSDRNAGFECDRNNGVGKTNPAHTGCKSAATPPNVKSPNAKPPNAKPPNAKPPNVTPPKAGPAKGISPNVRAVLAPAVLGSSAVSGATNPLPTSAAAGEADTGGRLVTGGFIAFAGFIALGTGAGLRRRHGA